MHEPARQEQPAPHPARQLVDRVSAARTEARQVEPALHRRPDVGDAVEAREYGEVVFDGDVDVEVVELGHDPHLGASRLGLARQLVTEHAQLARVGDRLPREQSHRGGLAGAVGAEQSEADAHRHLEVEPVHRRDRAEPLDHAFELDRSHYEIRIRGSSSENGVVRPPRTRGGPTAGPPARRFRSG